MFEILGACIAVFLGISMAADMGITMFAIPYYMLEFAKECWNHGEIALKIIALPLFVIGGVLHVLARVVWYGIFIALGAGVIYLLGYSVIRVFFL